MGVRLARRSGPVLLRGGRAGAGMLDVGRRFAIMSWALKVCCDVWCKLPPDGSWRGRCREDAKMKVYVKVDMEGITGIVSDEQAVPGRPEYPFGRKMLMNDLSAVLSATLGSGGEALVYDMHCAGRNVDLESIDRRAVVICGKPRFCGSFSFGLDESFDAVFLVGFHARAGTPGALLAHTYEEDVAEMKLNGRAVGEIGMEAALAGEFGVPVAFVSGDSAGMAEARELLGDEIETVAVKESISSTAGACLPAGQTRALLQEAAARAVEKAPNLPPFVCQAPAELAVAFTTPQSAEALDGAPEITRTGPTEITVHGENLLSAYRSYILAREQRTGASEN